MGRLLLVIAALAALCGHAQALPLDLNDPSSRAVLVEIERSIDDTVVGAVYFPPVPGAYTSDGTTATIAVSGASIEALYAAGSGFPPIPGTFTDLIAEITIATLRVTVQSSDMGFMGPAGAFGFFGGLLDTSATGGVFTNFNNVFCTAPISESPCQLIPGSPYDPATGTLNAVGSRTSPFDPHTGSTDLPPFFDPHGDLRISEIPEPGTALLLVLGLTGLASSRRRSDADESYPRGARQPWDSSRGSISARAAAESPA